MFETIPSRHALQQSFLLADQLSSLSVQVLLFATVAYSIDFSANYPVCIDLVSIDHTQQRGLLAASRDLQTYSNMLNLHVKRSPSAEPFQKSLV